MTIVVHKLLLIAAALVAVAPTGAHAGKGGSAVTENFSSFVMLFAYYGFVMVMYVARCPVHFASSMFSDRSPYSSRPST